VEPGLRGNLLRRLSTAAAGNISCRRSSFLAR
jgi:hypothetical protein